LLHIRLYPLNLLCRDDNTDSNEEQNWSRGRMEMLYKEDRPASPGEWSSSWRRRKTPLMEMDFPSYKDGTYLASG
jgi:hypothetical protein